LRQAQLAETAAAVREFGRKVSIHTVDMADQDAVAAVPEAVQAEHGRLDILVNNAGVALIGDFEQVSDADVDWIMDINFRAVVRMTRGCMPLLKAAPEARIVNISSIFGVITPPGQAAYCASKFAVRGFSNALRYELRGGSVGVTVIHPGGVATEIASSARSGGGVSNMQTSTMKDAAKKALIMPPAKAGELITKAIERRRARLLMGADAKFLGLVERLFPVNNYDIVERLFPSLAKSRKAWKSEEASSGVGSTADAGSKA
ncbi:MAG: SDR family NAD(P)-dependent oxidoreductase, partial [Pseudomonadota bacterium]